MSEVSKVILDGVTLMDVTQDTVNSTNTLYGETGHKNDGASFTGELTLNDVVISDVTDSDGGVIRTITTLLNPVILQSKTVTPSSEVQTIVPDSGYDGLNKITVLGMSDVMFYDYDGTILYAYTSNDFLSLTSMPPNPSHTGIISQGWNWSLSDAQTFVRKYGKIDIGQMYITDDGATRLYIHIGNLSTVNGLDMSVFSVMFSSSVINNATIDWGDGTSQTVGSTTATTYTHSYSSTGSYIVSILVNSGTITLGNEASSSSGYSIVGGLATNQYKYNAIRIKKVEIGTNVYLSPYCFYQCYLIDFITIPNTITSIGKTVFYFGNATNPSSLYSLIIPNSVTSFGGSDGYALYCTPKLKSISIPNSVINIGNNFISGATGSSIGRVVLPDSITAISNNFLTYSNNLTEVIIPESVTTIGTSFLNNSSKIEELTIPKNIISMSQIGIITPHMTLHMQASSPPVLSSTLFATGYDGIIYVPYSSDHSILNAYQTATNWATWADFMQEESQ